MRWLHPRAARTAPSVTRGTIARGIGIGIALAAFLSLVRAASGAEPTISATPLSVPVPAQESSGPSVIKWDGGTNTYARVYLKVGDAAETLFGSTAKGTKTATIAVGKPHLFRLYSTPLKTKVLSSVTVNAVHPPPPSTPPATPSGGEGLFDGRSPTRERVEAAQILVRDLQVVPSANNVEVRFNGPPNTVPLLEIGTERPLRGPDGRWSFAPGQGSTTYPVGGNKATGEYRIDIGFITELQANATYHYILNARTDNTDPNARRQQVIGAFTTVSQTVTVVFTNIDVVSDSDPDSDGELYFNFWANAGPKGIDYNDPTNAMKRLGSYRKPMHWGEGPHPIDVRLALRNAPDQLTLQVDGRDDDRLPLTDLVGSVTGEPPLQGSGDDGLDEFNLAKQTFDLTEHPGPSARFEFRIPTMDSHGTDFAFIIYGYVEINRTGVKAPPAATPASRVLPRPKRGSPYIRQ